MRNDRTRLRARPSLSLTGVEIAALIAVVRMEGSGYGVAIHDELESFLGRPVSTAAVYAALERLKQRALLRTTIAAPLAVPGGRSKRLYELTKTGRTFLEAEKVESIRLWQALPSHFGRG